MLDPDTGPGQVYAGPGRVAPLRCYESLLDSLSQLMRLVGQVLFPAAERRTLGGRGQPLGGRRTARSAAGSGPRCTGVSGSGP